ncbi:MAG: GNAT family N-acetyltransferase [Anaerolineales bacterium]|nr:GNAT family N-acetyltransferase [Anaerolineales bacterium]
MIIRPMQLADLDFAAACTQAEGWASEDHTALLGFFLADPLGCLLAELHGQPLGICVATSYGYSGFIGELIVLPQARGQGIGAALLNRAVNLLQQRGARTVYLDGVLQAVELYERNGFRKLTRSWRFSGRLPGRAHPEVVPMQAQHLSQVFAFDQAVFGADRSFFLGRRWSLFPELGRVLVQDDQVQGYLLGRRGPGWLVVGPWVVNPAVAGPHCLLESLALDAGDDILKLGILDTHQQACTLVEALGLTPRPESPWRMALGPDDFLGASPFCYAIGSPAKG